MRECAGVEIIIAKAGNPIVRLTRVAGHFKKKKLGLLRDKIKVIDDFNEPGAQITEDFQGN